MILENSALSVGLSVAANAIYDALKRIASKRMDSGNEPFKDWEEFCRNATCLNDLLWKYRRFLGSCRMVATRSILSRHQDEIIKAFWKMVNGKIFSPDVNELPVIPDEELEFFKAGLCECTQNAQSAIGNLFTGLNEISSAFDDLRQHYLRSHVFALKN